MASTSLAVIRTLTIRAKTEGVDQAASSLGKLAGEQEKVAKSSTQLERATLSQEKAFQRFEKSIDPAARAQAKLAEAAKQLQRAQDAGLITQARSSELMQLAIRAHNSSGDAAKKHSQALQELSTVGQGLSGNLGSIGGILARMGPAGLAAAGVFGGLALAMTAAATAALGLADHAGKLVDLSDSIGITVTGLQALQEAASQVGVSEEQLSTQLEKFSAVLGNLRDSNKGAIETFERLGEGFAQQVANATSFEDALNLVYAQVNKLDTAAKSAAIKELFGKGATGQGRIAQLIADAQGIQGFLAQMDKAGILTRKQAEEFDKLGDSINRAFKVAGLNFVQSFAGPVLTNLKELTTQLLAMSKIAGDIAAPLAQAFGGDILAKITSLRDAMTEFAASLEGLTQAQKVQAVLDNLIDPRLIQFFKDLGQAIVDLITLIGQLATAMGQLVTLNFSGALSSVQAGIASFDQLKTSISNLGTTLTTEGTRGTQALQGVNVEAANLDKTIDDLVTGIPKDLGLKPEMAAPLKPVKLAFDDVGKSAGRAAKTIKEEVNPVLQELGQVAGQLGGALVTAFLNGDSAAKALNQTLKSISSSAASTAINKLVTGDFAGAAVSGAISIGTAIGSFLFGDDEDEKAQQEAAKQAAEAARAAAEALQQARDAFAGLSREIQEFTNTANGTQIGELTQALADFSDQSVELQEAAIAAQNETALAAIRQTAAVGMNRFLRQFLNDVDDLISEFGTEGIMQEARQSVRDLMLQYSSLQDSIDEFARRTGADTEILRQNLQGSAFKALVEMLGDVPEISETANEIQRLKGVASELDDALVQLGVAAEDAAIIVEQRLAASLARLAGNFLDPIIREINEFVGGGWINQATDLLARVRQLTADATALGLDTTLIQTLFVLSAQDIINQNQLVGASFQALVRMLGLADAGLHQFTDTVEDAAAVIVRSAQEIANAIQANEDRLFLAIHRSDSLADQLARFDLAAQREREREIAAGGQALASLERAIMQERINIINDYNAQQLAAQQAAAQQAAEEAARVRREQIEAAQRAAEERARVLKEATDFIQGQVRRINDWINNFLSGEQSILKPSQQMATARTHFASELSLAASGNRDALSNITTSAQQVVDSVRRYYGSSAAGQAIIQQLLTSLRTLPGQLSPEEFIVQGLTTPINNIPPAVVPPIVGGIIDQTTVLQALLNNLKTAIQTGDAQATAIALLPLFDQLDTTMDQALSFQELVQGLGSTFNTGTLRAIFTELDGNGNGLLEKSELIKAATQGTKNSTDESNDLLQKTIDRIAAGTAETVLWLKNIWDKINILIQQIIDGVRAPLMTIAAWAPGSNHAMGGWISGGVPGRDSVNARLMPGEFVVREAIARNNPWLEGFNQSGMYPAANDNASVVAAIGRLERSLLRGFKALIETELEAAGVIAKPIQEANKITRTRRGEKKKVA